MNRSDEDRALATATKLARILDARFVDPLLGLLLPGIGDLLGGALGLYAVAAAWRLRAPKVLIARMLLNLSVDLLGGLVPVLGDVWDFLFRAHRRNLELLRTRRREGEVRASAGDWLLVAGAFIVFLLALAAPLLLLVMALTALMRAFG